MKISKRDIKKLNESFKEWIQLTESENTESEGYKYKVSNINWDASKSDIKDYKLPSTLIVEVPEQIVAGGEEEDWISDYLSDTYGFCHNGFLYIPC